MVVLNEVAAERATRRRASKRRSETKSKHLTIYLAQACAMASVVSLAASQASQKLMDGRSRNFGEDKLMILLTSVETAAFFFLHPCKQMSTNDTCIICLALMYIQPTAIRSVWISLHQAQHFNLNSQTVSGLVEHAVRHDRLGFSTKPIFDHSSQRKA